GEQRIDEHLARHVDVELVADDPRQRDEDERANGERDDGATRHICTRPNNPCGRNTSTSTIGRNRTKKARTGTNAAPKMEEKATMKMPTKAASKQTAPPQDP